MAVEKSLTILIPSRNELFLSKTIENILENMRGDTSIIAVCDGNWPDPPVKDHPKVTLIHHSESIGQRAATNEAAKLARSKYVMKCDAHCSFAEGFDVILMEDMQDDWTMVPIMKNLHAFDWLCEEGHRRYQSPSGPCTQCGKPTTRDIIWFAKNNPQSTAYLFDSEPHFQYFKDYKNRDEYKKALKNGYITETMSLQGSCWMLTRDKYFELDMDDNDFGSWGSQGIETACKTWLSGGRVVVNHRTWYGHQFRTQGGDFGFPYPISGRQVQHAKKRAKEIFFNNQWSKQKRNLSWLLEKFWPLPGWTEEELNQVKANDLKHLERWNGSLPKSTAEAKVMTNLVSTSEAEPIAEDVENPALSVQVRPQRGIIYYTDNRGDHRVLEACRKQVLEITKGEYEIVSASLKPIDFGKNIVLDLERSVLTMFKQTLAAIEASTAEILYFCFPKGVYVETDLGLKKIERIQIGDMVRTHLNRFRPVKNIMKREYKQKSPLIQIRTQNSKVKCTPEHPFLVYRNNDKHWIMAKDIQKEDCLLYPYEAHDDYVDFNIKLKSAPYGGQFGSTDRQIDRIQVDEDLARFMGLFLAEGHCNGKNGIGFTFNNSEVEYIDFVKKVCIDKFQREPRSRSHWATQVLINISALCPLFKEWFGDHSHTRKIPEFVFGWNLKNRIAFVKGFLEGDGVKHQYSDGLAFIYTCVSSHQLVEDLIKLMNQSGIGYDNEIKINYTGKNSIGIDKWSYRVNLVKSSYFKALDILNGKAIDGYLTIPIYNIKEVGMFNNKIKENGIIIGKEKYVYNLEVEEDNSYIVESAIVHNCEHDVLYHPTHFDFTPARNDVFYYDENRWFVDLATGRALFYHACSTSLLVANRELLLEHYRTRVARVEKEGFTLRLGYEPGNHPFPRGVDMYTRATYFAKYPSLDIRHGKNLTPSRWSQDQFRNKSNLHAWTEKSMHDKLPGWGTVEEALKKIKD